MKNYPFHFLLGFVVTFIPLIFLIKSHRQSFETPEVMAETDQQVEIDDKQPDEEVEKAVAVGFEEEKVNPTETPSPSATPTPRPTAIPIPTHTPMPTLTPEPTPTPVPTPTPDVWSPPEMETWFSQYAGQYGVDKNILERLANCESHFNPDAVNGAYVGMFQFSPNTWITNRQAIGFDENLDLRSNVEESIRTAAYLISQRGVEPWPNCLR